MGIKIDQKIVGYTVKAASDASKPPEKVLGIKMNEGIERPETLLGVSYKIRSPMAEHAIYITINDMVLNLGAVDEHRRPFEIFINSKNMDHFQWIVALTRIMSAVFRKGGDVTFLVEEMKAIFDPRGGYLKRGGIFMPSLVAEIGTVLEQHLQNIGMLEKPSLSDAQKTLIAEKRAAFEGASAPAVDAKSAARMAAFDSAPVAVIDTHTNENGSYSISGSSDLPESAFWGIDGKRVRLVIDEEDSKDDGLQVTDSATSNDEAFDGNTEEPDSSYPATATVCTKCSVKAVIVMDGCQVCLSCADSKCS